MVHRGILFQRISVENETVALGGKKKKHGRCRTLGSPISEVSKQNCEFLFLVTSHFQNCIFSKPVMLALHPGERAGFRIQLLRHSIFSESGTGEVWKLGKQAESLESQTSILPRKGQAKPSQPWLLTCNMGEILTCLTVWQLLNVLRAP